MSTATTAGVLLIAVPLAFNAAFALLAARLDYPDILCQPTADVLRKFSAGGTPLVLLWWASALTAVLLAPTVVLLSSAIADADPTLLTVTTTVGVLAALVQLLGLVRWPFLLPYLARAAADPDASQRDRAEPQVAANQNRGTCFIRPAGARGDRRRIALPAGGRRRADRPADRCVAHRVTATFRGSSHMRRGAGGSVGSTPFSPS